MPLIALLVISCSGKDPDGGSSGDGDGDGDIVEGRACIFGDDPDKCDGREDFACTPVPVETGDACNSDDDCAAGALCFASMDPDASTGECLELTGVCLAVGATETGDPFGTPCTVGEETCAGRCVAIDGDEGECEESCRVGAASGCGEDELSGSGVACAFFAYDLSDIGESQGNGDVGVCALLCDCNDDCPGNQLCLDQPTDGYAGICAGGLATDDAISCDDNLGGAGGGRPN